MHIILSFPVFIWANVSTNSGPKGNSPKEFSCWVLSASSEPGDGWLMSWLLQTDLCLLRRTLLTVRVCMDLLLRLPPPSGYITGAHSLRNSPRRNWRDGSAVNYLLFSRKDWDLIPRPHRVAHNPSSRGSNILYWPLQVPDTLILHICTCRQNTHTHTFFERDSCLSHIHLIACFFHSIKQF